MKVNNYKLFLEACCVVGAALIFGDVFGLWVAGVWLLVYGFLSWWSVLNG